MFWSLMSTPERSIFFNFHITAGDLRRAGCTPPWWFTTRIRFKCGIRWPNTTTKFHTSHGAPMIRSSSLVPSTIGPWCGMPRFVASQSGFSASITNRWYSPDAASWRSIITLSLWRVLHGLLMGIALSRRRWTGKPSYVFGVWTARCYIPGPLIIAYRIVPYPQMNSASWRYQLRSRYSFTISSHGRSNIASCWNATWHPWVSAETRDTCWSTPPIMKFTWSILKRQISCENLSVKSKEISSSEVHLVGRTRTWSSAGARVLSFQALKLISESVTVDFHCLSRFESVHMAQRKRHVDWNPQRAHERLRERGSVEPGWPIHVRFRRWRPKSSNVRSPSSLTHHAIDSTDNSLIIQTDGLKKPNQALEGEAAEVVLTHPSELTQEEQHINHRLQFYSCIHWYPHSRFILATIAILLDYSCNTSFLLTFLQAQHSIFAPFFFPASAQIALERESHETCWIFGHHGRGLRMERRIFRIRNQIPGSGGWLRRTIQFVRP